MNRHEPTGQVDSDVVDAQQLRSQARARRRSAAASEQVAGSIAIARRVTTWLGAQHTRSIGAYLPTGGEVDPARILTWADACGVDVALPVTPPGSPQALIFRRYRLGDQLVAGRFSLLEPSDDAPLVDPSALDVVLVPVVLADATGQRMGSGFGYYDRTFAFVDEPTTTRPTLVGLAYEWQMSNTLAGNDWDVALDVIVTETKFVATGARSKISSNPTNEPNQSLS